MKDILEYLLDLYEKSKPLFYRESKVLKHKNLNDVLSEADLRLNEYFYSNIKNEYPLANIIAEESDNLDLTDALTFVIDPLDGTCNYSNGLNLCGIQMAVFLNKECIISLIGLPYYDEVFYAIKNEGAYKNGNKISVNNTIKASDGILELSDFYRVNDDIEYDMQFELVKELQNKFLKIRLFGAACIDFTNLIKNNAQAYICYYRYIWDVAPGLLLAKEAGMLYSGINNDYKYGNHSIILANNMNTLKMIIDEIKRIRVK